jgi:hypothetical protein
VTKFKVGFTLYANSSHFEKEVKLRESERESERERERES